MIIYSANLQHGQKTDGTFDYAAQVSAVADADIVCVQERSTSDTGWDASLASNGLSQAAFHQHLGAGDGPAIWIKTATVTSVQTYSVDLDPTGGSPILGWDGVDIRRGAVAAKLQIGGRQLYVVAAHLVAASGEDNSNTNFAATRVTQISSLLAWISSTLTGGLPIVIAGDMNLPPNYPRAPERSFTADSDTDTLTSTGHGFTNGMAVALRNSGGAPPTPLLVGNDLYALATVYYVRDAAANTFKLAYVPGGPAIGLNDNGSGSHFACATQWDLLRADYYDLWQEGMNTGAATMNWGDRDGNAQVDNPLHFQLTITHDTRRIDYILLDRASTQLRLAAITVPDSRATCPHGLVDGACTPEVTQLTGTALDAGVRASDHNFVRAELQFVSNRSKLVPICM